MRRPFQPCPTAEAGRFVLVVLVFSAALCRAGGNPHKPGGGKLRRRDLGKWERASEKTVKIPAFGGALVNFETGARG